MKYFTKTILFFLASVIFGFFGHSLGIVESVEEVPCKDSHGRVFVDELCEKVDKTIPGVNDYVMVSSFLILLSFSMYNFIMWIIGGDRE